VKSRYLPCGPYSLTMLIEAVNRRLSDPDAEWWVASFTYDTEQHAYVAHMFEDVEEAMHKGEVLTSGEADDI
jgi:uncharacterized lipoprotein YmbA